MLPPVTAQTLKMFLNTTVDKQVRDIVKGINNLEKLHSQGKSDNLSMTFENERICLMLESQMRDLSKLIATFMGNHCGIVGFQDDI